LESGYFLVSLDLGLAGEPTALAIVKPASEYFYASPFTCEIDHENSYDVVHLERFGAGVGLPVIVERVGEILDAVDQQKRPRIPEHQLLLNITSVGKPALRYFRAQKLPPRQVFTIVNGGAEAWTNGVRTVAKRSIITTALIALQTRHLRIARKLELGPVLQEELLNFRMNPPKLTDSIEAIREGPNDDLVFAVSIACWWGERYSWNDEDYEQMKPPPDFDEVRRGAAYG
jgi:hypothetical protein